DVDFRENALLAEGFGEERSVADLVADGADVGAELGVGKAVGEEVEAFEDREAGADEGDELLVEDQELLEVDLLAFGEAAGGGGKRGGEGTGLDGVDQEALLRVFIAEFLFRSGSGYLLMDLAAGVGVFENEVAHCCSTSSTPLGGWNWNS